MSVVNMLVGGLGAALPSTAGRVTKVLARVIDAAVQNLAAADIAVALYIPPRTRVLGVRLEVETVEGAAGTVNVGIFSDAGVTAVDANGFLAASDVNALTHLHSADGAAAYAVTGYTTGAAGAYLCLTAIEALDAAKIVLQAECVEYAR
jgi:hypothetical protein